MVRHTAKIIVQVYRLLRPQGGSTYVLYYVNSTNVLPFLVLYIIIKRCVPPLFWPTRGVTF
jgi:hypothetical protein